MRRIVFFVLALLGTSVAAARGKAEVAYPLAAGLPVQVVQDPAPSIVLAYPNYGQQAGTFLGAVLASSMRNHERGAEPLRRHMEAAGLAEYFREQLLPVVPALVPSARIESVSAPWSLEQAFDRTRASDGQFVSVVPYYAFSPFMDAVGGYVELWVSRVERTEGGKLREKVLDHRVFAFEQHFQGWTGPSAKASVVPWLLLGAPKVEVAFRESIDQAVAMLAYQATNEAQEEARLKNRKHDGKVLGMKVPGRLVRTGADWFWFREKVNDQLVGFGIVETGAAP